MLPSTLTPASITPETTSQRLRLLTALKRIEFVEVTSAAPRDGERMYVVGSHEYASTTSRIPAAAPTAMQHRSPRDCTARSSRVVARVERDYFAFDDLRLNVFLSIRNAHFQAYCDFCRSVLRSFDTAKNRPGTILRLMGSDRKIVQTLTKFLNTLLGIVKRNEDALRCHGQDQACVLLHAFLLQQDQQE